MNESTDEAVREMFRELCGFEPNPVVVSGIVKIVDGLLLRLEEKTGGFSDHLRSLIRQSFVGLLAQGYLTGMAPMHWPTQSLEGSMISVAMDAFGAYVPTRVLKAVRIREGSADRPESIYLVPSAEATRSDAQMLADIEHNLWPDDSNG